MGYWFFLLLVCLLCPIIMIYLGSILKQGEQNEISETYGYRTSLAMKNFDTWQFSQQVLGKLYYRFGWILFFLSTGLMYWIQTTTSNIEYITMFALAIILSQLLVMMIQIIVTGFQLRKNFDEEGRRRHF